MRLLGTTSQEHRPRPFRFLPCWQEYPEFENFLEKTNSTEGSLEVKIPRLQVQLRRWNRKVFGHIFNRKKRCLQRLEWVQKYLPQSRNTFVQYLEHTFIEEYNEILKQEESFCLQKSRVRWLNVGEGSTR